MLTTSRSLFVPLVAMVQPPKYVSILGLRKLIGLRLDSNFLLNQFKSYKRKNHRLTFVRGLFLNLACLSLGALNHDHGEMSH